MIDEGEGIQWEDLDEEVGSKDRWQAGLPLRANRRLKNGFRNENLGLPDILKRL